MTLHEATQRLLSWHDGVDPDAKPEPVRTVAITETAAPLPADIHDRLCEAIETGRAVPGADLAGDLNVYERVARAVAGS